MTEKEKGMSINIKFSGTQTLVTSEKQGYRLKIFQHSSIIEEYRRCLSNPFYNFICGAATYYPSIFKLPFHVSSAFGRILNNILYFSSLCYF